MTTKPTPAAVLASVTTRLSNVLSEPSEGPAFAAETALLAAVSMALRGCGARRPAEIAACYAAMASHLVRAERAWIDGVRATWQKSRDATEAFLGREVARVPGPDRDEPANDALRTNPPRGVNAKRAPGEIRRLAQSLAAGRWCHDDYDALVANAIAAVSFAAASCKSASASARLTRVLADLGIRRENAASCRAYDLAIARHERVMALIAERRQADRDLAALAEQRGDNWHSPEKVDTLVTLLSQTMTCSQKSGQNLAS